MSIISNNSKSIAISILIGGKSTRFGSDKGLFVFFGKPLISYQLETLSHLNYDIFLVAHSLNQVQDYMKKIDITKIQDMPQSILSDMQDNRLFNQKIASKIHILAGTEDDVVPSDWIIEFAKAQRVTVRFFDDDHGFSYNMNKLPDIISNILNKKH